jgi:hypothetical protein
MGREGKDRAGRGREQEMRKKERYKTRKHK